MFTYKCRTINLEKPQIIVNNSYSKIVGFSQEVFNSVDQILTYQKDIEPEKNALFQKMKWLKTLVDKDPKARKQLGYCKKLLKELLESEFTKWLSLDGNFPTGHLNIVKDVVDSFEQNYQLIDLRVRPEKRHKFVLCEDFPEPRYYQKEMHQLGLAQGRGVFNASVASGKTLIFMRLIYELGVTSLIIVPSKSLVLQWEEELVRYFGPRNVAVISSESPSSSQLRSLKKKPIRLVNIQALAALNKKEDLSDIISDVDAFFYDEFHHAASKSTTELLPLLEHVFYRFGATGTFVRPDGRVLDMWGVLSNVIYRYEPWRAKEDGFVTPFEVFEYGLPGVDKKNFQREYELNYCGNVLLHKKILEIIKTKVKPKESVLILVNRKEKSGELIHEFLLKNHVKNTYVSGDTDKDEVNETLKLFNDKQIQVLIGSSVLGEGIDIRSTDHLIMAQGMKSEIAISQSVGRLIRLYPGKSTGYLHDFNFTETNYLSDHAEQRLEIYRTNFAPNKFHKKVD